jgi:GT2 family glycosyltransferase
MLVAFFLYCNKSLGMKLSVVIVNYNVKYFLEQALHSVFNALKNVEGEVFVVDNNSADGSCEMVKRKFPQVILIENKSNTGFSVANNQAIKQATGEYVLLLNPDTVVEEDCFTQCIQFMDAHADAGALGVKMIDGKGAFLPESKRGLPTPEIAFYKMFGLAALFPKSKLFGGYHLGYLSNDEVHEVDVLSGAFMLLRKTALDKTGLLDEDYFMYGEDIDLSYRITKEGYKNYYFPHTTIIHYKGESTKKTSVNYVFVFYRAMIIFAQKHYSSKHAQMFNLLISLAIYLRAAVSIGARFIQSTKLVLFDAASIYGGIYLIKTYWEINHKFVEGGSYPDSFMYINATIYTLCWILGLYLAGAYEKTRSVTAIAKGAFWGLIGISVLYAFAPLSFRFSRAIIMLSFVWAFVAPYLIRLIAYMLKFRKMSLSMAYDANTIIVGNKEEAYRVMELLNKVKAQCKVAGYVAIKPTDNETDNYLGQVNNLENIAALFKAEEIIFCSKDVSSSEIIQWMRNINIAGIQYKIVPEESSFIIGSNSKNTAGDFYALDINMALSEPLHIRKKRLFDIVISFVLLLLTPLLIFIIKHPIAYLKNLYQVFIGQKTWVGYLHGNQKGLPKLKTGVLNPASNKTEKIETAAANKLNWLYAKNYAIDKDFLILLFSIRKLGG